MILDVVIGLTVLFGAYRASFRGSMRATWSIAGVVSAAAGARYLSRPTAHWITTGIEWSYSYAVGLSFFIEFGLLLLVFSFILGPSLQRAEQRAHGSMLDQLVGGILGGLRNTVIVYCLIGAMMLCTQRWGSRRPSLAIQYQTSKAAMWLMTHNLISPEPYPHAFVLRGILGYETGIHEASNDALITLRAHPMTEFLRADETLHAHIWNKNWRQLHSHSALLSLTTNPEFLYYAKIISTPQNTATEEEPTDRFQELR